nr:sialidase family protein [Angustibacter aerolatus]
MPRLPRLLTAALAGALTAAGLVAVAPSPAQAATSCTWTPFRSSPAAKRWYRIPSVVRTGSGALVAFAERRDRVLGDDGDFDVVTARSTDGGCTWSGARAIGDDGPNRVSNPVPVVDAATGRVLVLSVVTPRAGGRAAHKGLHVQTSRDDGRTFSALGAPVRPSGTYRGGLTGPGHAVQAHSLARRAHRRPARVPHVGRSVRRVRHLLRRSRCDVAHRVRPAGHHRPGALHGGHRRRAVRRVAVHRLPVAGRRRGGRDGTPARAVDGRRPDAAPALHPLIAADRDGAGQRARPAVRAAALLRTRRPDADAAAGHDRLQQQHPGFHVEPGLPGRAREHARLVLGPRPARRAHRRHPLRDRDEHLEGAHPLPPPRDRAGSRSRRRSRPPPGSAAPPGRPGRRRVPA